MGRLRKVRVHRMSLIAAASVLLAGIAPHATAAQGADEVSVVVEIKSSDQPAMEMKYWLGKERMRMDATPASIVWFGGANSRMLMIQHPQRSYMEFTSDQLEMMRQMAQGIPGAGGQSPQQLDPASVRFRATGRRETIGSWDAFEVRVEGLVPGQEGSLWLTEDVDTGMFEVFARLSEVVEAMQMPMGMGGSNPQQELLRYSELANAAGLPDGRAVRFTSSEGGKTTSVTLTEIQAGPFPEDTFGAPAGYQSMQMPTLPFRRD